MPPKSEQQRKAMGAAASGKSTLGIPKSVGQDFIAADAGGPLPPKAPSEGLGQKIAKQRGGKPPFAKK